MTVLWRRKSLTATLPLRTFVSVEPSQRSWTSQVVPRTLADECRPRVRKRPRPRPHSRRPRPRRRRRASVTARPDLAGLQLSFPASRSPGIGLGERRSRPLNGPAEKTPGVGFEPERFAAPISRALPFRASIKQPTGRLLASSSPRFLSPLHL